MADFIELRQLVAAIVLSRELDYAAAAKLLGISRTALQHEIAALEAKHRVKIFVRKRSRATLTEAGRAFIDEGHSTLLREEKALQFAQKAAQTVKSNLTIGRTPYTDPSLLSTLMSVRLPLYPDLRIELYSAFSADLVERPLSSNLDLALVANMSPREPLNSMNVSEEPFYIALPQSHPLLQMESVTLRDLVEDTWIIFERKVRPGMYDAILNRAKEEGIVIDFGPHIVTLEEAYQFVSRNVGIAFVNKPSARSLAERGIDVRPLEDSELRVEVRLAWRSDKESKLVASFADSFIKQALPALKAAGAIPSCAGPLSFQPVEKLLLRGHSRNVLMDVAEIEWIESQDYYVAVHSQGRRLLFRESLSSLEPRLKSNAFIRIHRGAIVNLAHVKDVQFGEGGQSVVLMRNGTAVPMSSRRRSQIKHAPKRYAG